MNARRLRALLALAVAAKALDVLVVGTVVLGAWPALPLGLATMVGAVAVLAGLRARDDHDRRADRRPPGRSEGRDLERFGWAIVTLALVAMLPTLLYRNHVAFLAWTAAALALTSDAAERRLLLTGHLAAVYGFAAVTKLQPEWWSGDILVGYEARLFAVPPAAAAWAALVAEAALAIAVWRPRPAWIGAAALMHAAFVIGMSVSLVGFGRLVIFNGAAVIVWLLVWEFGREAPGPVLAPLRRL